MGKFRDEGKKGQPAVSTAALPDIVFMLLFFFMIATSPKTDNYQNFIELKKPKATELTNLAKKDLIPNIYLGRPKAKYKELGDYILVVNDKPSNSIGVIRPYLQDFVASIDAERRADIIPQFTVDRNAKMGYVEDIREEIGYSGLLTISYGADQGDIADNAN